MTMSTSSTEQQLRFRWNDHMQHLSKVLMLQRLQEQYCDITLVSEDGFLTKAHQAVLASTSSYFERVLADIRPEQHPMVVLRGANLQELTCLLDFMYQGNTQVEQSLIESVLEVADLLGVKGLSGIRSNPAIKKFMTTPPATTAPPVPPAPPPPQPGTDGGGEEEEEEEAQDPLSPTSVTPKEPDPPQTSGIDLSMTKNEPRSPKEVAVASCPPPHTMAREGGQGEREREAPPPPPPPPPPPAPPHTPCRKRRRLDSPSSEDNMDSASDPDWGRIGSKVEDSPRPAADAQPRTITLTAISSAVATAATTATPLDTTSATTITPTAATTATTTRPPSPSSPPWPFVSVATVEEERIQKPKNVVKRPMNKYVLFFKHFMPKVRQQYPHEEYQSITHRIAALWKNLPQAKKDVWKERAQRLQEEHKRRYPNYTYNPQEAQQRKREYNRLKEERRAMYSITEHQPLHTTQPRPLTQHKVEEQGGARQRQWKLLEVSDWHFIGGK